MWGWQPIHNTSFENPTDQSDTVLDVMLQFELYAQLVIIPIGMVLNFLCLIIFIKSKTHKSPTGIHLTYLAVADTIVLA